MLSNGDLLSHLSYIINVSALWGNTNPRNCVFSVCCTPISCLENDTAAGASEVPDSMFRDSMFCCRLHLLLGRESVHCSVASQLAEWSRLYAPSNAKKRDIAPERLHALLANVLLVADGVRCCLKTGLHWAVLRLARGESGRQILRWWVSKIRQAKVVSFLRHGMQHMTKRV